ncbi:hypothetical protein H0H93_008569 [Arthromyces matolae]|nr:hypothetical protein H0H93_008569 [Arthromyces matolae]
MSFLHRRRSFGPTVFPSTSENSESQAPISFPPPVENIHTKGRKTSGGAIITRVSSLLSKKKRPTAFAPLDVHRPLATPTPKWKVVSEGSSSPTNSEASFDDIRRPSGLGRSVSISSNRSLPHSPLSPVNEEWPLPSGYERVRALSSPNLLRIKPTDPTKVTTLPRSLTVSRRFQDCPPPPLPHEVLVNILEYSPRHTTAYMASASRDWCAAARLVLYRTLDLRTLRSKQVESLVTLLAYRHDLTDLVRSFECHKWPEFFPPSPKLNKGTYSSPSPFSPALTAVFTIAFQNMHSITSLVLPTFDHTFLRHHSAFGLRKLVFLFRTISPEETTQLFAWLDGQTNITHLAFPNLMDSNTPSLTIPKSSPTALMDTSNMYNVSTPNLSPSLSPVSPSTYVPFTPASPFDSLNLLPALNNLVAAPSIVTPLITGRHSAVFRPLAHVTVNINNTLYTGLRPSSLLALLRGIPSIVLKFSIAVDRRSIGKVITAGAVLTSSSVSEASSSSTTDSFDSGGSDITPPLQHLGIQISDTAPGIDKVTSAFDSSESPKLIVTIQALYKMVSSSISRYEGLLSLHCCFTQETWPDLGASPPLSDGEKAEVALWRKNCPSLKSITMLSGASWKRD